MKRALVLVMLLGTSSQVQADSRDAWQAAFAGSVTVAIGGVITWRHGANKVSEAEDQLCAGGAYRECTATGSQLSTAEVAQINAKGNRGETIAQIGAGTAIVGLGMAGVSFYMGFLSKRRDERPRVTGRSGPARRPERDVVVAPTISRDGAGAALSLRW
jgi:hypothetical protein